MGILTGNPDRRERIKLDDKRTIIVSYEDQAAYWVEDRQMAIKSPHNNRIYVRLSREGLKTKAEAKSLWLFETPNNVSSSSHFYSPHVYLDSNFIDGKRVMHHQDYIDVLAALNKAKVIDETHREGMLAVEKLSRLNNL